jgi:hypothetical protein
MAADRVIRWTTAAGVVGASAVAALAANVVQGLGHGLTGASVAARPAVVVGSNELLMLIISSVQGQVGEPDASGEPDRELDADPLQARAAQMFTLDLAAGMRALCVRPHVGQPRVQRVRVTGPLTNVWPAGAAGVSAPEGTGIPLRRGGCSAWHGGNACGQCGAWRGCLRTPLVVAS